MEQPTLRELIMAKSELLRDVDALGPHRAAEELVALTSLLASLNKHISDRAYWLNVLKMQKLEEHKTATKAKIYAEASTEWKEWHEALMQGKALEEMIRSVKYYLRSQENEMKLQ